MRLLAQAVNLLYPALEAHKAVSHHPQASVWVPAASPSVLVVLHRLDPPDNLVAHLRLHHLAVLVAVIPAWVESMLACRCTVAMAGIILELGQEGLEEDLLGQEVPVEM